MTKPSSRASLRDQKAEALDSLVKAELTRKKEVISAKNARLRALRLAREEEEANTPSAPSPAKDKTRARKTLHLPRTS